ncbi:MAG: HAMP domain-containing sensor histidine kinase [Cyanobacteriota bacterium]|nr:HAMP domain-containing sensor histidine kinase [Cyanobacteriota bacterium]
MIEPVFPSDSEPLQLAYDRLRGQYHFLAGFLGTASHELRAPINQILSLHQLILEDLCESPAEEREFIAQANQAITRVLQNLDLLIRLSKLEIGALQPQWQTVPLLGLLAEVEQLTTMKCTNRHCRLQISLTPEPGMVYSDPQWLRQVLVLLVDGALAAGSRQLQISGEPQGLCLRSDSPWATTATPATEVAQPPEGFSPGFYYQVAARMAAALQLSLTLTEGGQVIDLQWPAA